jgi:hypothetical protein
MAVATVTIDTTHMVTKAERKAMEGTGAQAMVRPAATWVIGPRTAKQTLKQVLQPCLPSPIWNQSCWERRRPIDNFLSSVLPCKVKKLGP